jgi:hypothetical protein
VWKRGDRAGCLIIILPSCFSSNLPRLSQQPLTPPKWREKGKEGDVAGATVIWPDALLAMPVTLQR